MTQITWNDSLVIDLPRIDEQHKKLIDLSNGLIQAMIVGQGKEALEEVFQELKEYTVYHFSDEEKFMAQIEYPALHEHKALHENLISQVMKLENRLTSLSPNEVLDFINEWIATHIREEDSKISLYANNR